MAYGTLLTDAVQSSTANTPPQFNDGNGTQVGTLCRAWVRFGSASVTGSFNVSSMTFNASDVVVNFTTAMPDTNYCTVSMSESSATSLRVFEYNGQTKSTSQIQLQCVYANGLVTSWSGGNIAIFR